MKQKFISIFILILLSSCSSSTPAPTATFLPASTNTPLPTQSPTIVPTENPVVKEIDLNPETFKTEKWDYLISPEHLAKLYEEDAKGLLPNIPTNPSYVQSGFVGYKPDNPQSNVLKKYGVENIFTLSNEIVYLDKSKRPFVTVKAYNTELYGIKMIFLVDKWVNYDKSVAFVAHIIFDYNFTKDIFNSYQDTSRYPAGGYFIKNSERGDGCEAYINQLAESKIDSSKFCKYYYDNSQIFLPKDIYTDWQTTGILKTNGILLVSIAGTNKIRR